MNCYLFWQSPGGVPDIEIAFDKSLKIMQETKSFDVNVLYKPYNAVQEGQGRKDPQGKIKD